MPDTQRPHTVTASVTTFQQSHMSSSYLTVKTDNWSQSLFNRHIRTATQPKTATQQTIIQQYTDWYTGHWWVGCYIRYTEQGPGQAVAPPNSLLAVPNVTAHPSTASVPTSYYSMWHYKYPCTIKGSIIRFNCASFCAVLHVQLIHTCVLVFLTYKTAGCMPSLTLTVVSGFPGDLHLCGLTLWSLLTDHTASDSDHTASHAQLSPVMSQLTLALNVTLYVHLY